MKILFVINPIAGSRKIQDPVIRAKEFASKHNLEARFYRTTGETDEQKIMNIIDDFHPTRLVAGGGDGTVQLLGKIAIKQEIPLGVIPLGSANGLATELRLPKRISNALEVATGTNTKAVDVLKVNDQFCFHMCDLGLNAALIEQYEQGETRGFAGYALSILKGNVNLVEPFNIELKMEGEEISTLTYMAIFTNCQRFGTGVNINPEGKIADGKFESCLLRKVELREAIDHLFEEKTTKNDGIYQIHSAKEAQVTCSRSVRFQIDGEYIGRVDKLNLKNLPKVLKVAVG